MGDARYETEDASEGPRAFCQDCGRQYGHEHGFPDLIIPYWAWKQITPTVDDGGLLCPSCICKRLHDKGIRCEGAFMSGPIISVTEPTMNTMRRVENIELAIDGRDNRWVGVRTLLPEATSLESESAESAQPRNPAPPADHGSIVTRNV